jgi:hypothetical protein
MLSFCFPEATPPAASNRRGQRELDMKRITDWVHDGLRALLRPGDWAVDATLGNGHDAALLTICVGSTGRVWGFDVQEAALAATRLRLGAPPSFCALLADHAQLHEHLPPEARGRLRAVVFNLGYLPGGDHDLTTLRESSLAGLAVALDWLAPGGVLCCTCYPGRPQGLDEAQAVNAWFAGLPPSAGELTRIERAGTRQPAPFVLWLERPGEARSPAERPRG